MMQPWTSATYHICDDPREKGMFQDVDVKIQVRTYLNFDVNVLKHAFFPWIITYTQRQIVSVGARTMRKALVDTQEHFWKATKPMFRQVDV